MVHESHAEDTPLSPPTHNFQDSRLKDKAHLEELCRGMLEAVNLRNLDANSLAWSSVTAGYVAEIAFTAKPVKKNLEEHLRSLEAMCQESPTLYLKILDLQTSSADSPGHAHVFANLEWHGAPPGIVRPTYAIFDFVKAQSRWLCVKYRALPGVTRSWDN